MSHPYTSKPRKTSHHVVSGKLRLEKKNMVEITRKIHLLSWSIHKKKMQRLHSIAEWKKRTHRHPPGDSIRELLIPKLEVTNNYLKDHLSITKAA